MLKRINQLNFQNEFVGIGSSSAFSHLEKYIKFYIVLIGTI